MMHTSMAHSAYGSDAARWAAVSRRDRRADGQFFYAVRTTGVVCRPGCGSRSPLRKNVDYFGTLADALREGYRPCRRCRPGAGDSASAPEAVVAVCRRIESSDPVPSLASLGSGVGLSGSALHRLFRREMGITPKEYAEALKAQRFRQALENRRSVTDAVFEAGYGSASRAYERAKDHLGMKPSQYRDKARGVSVQFLTARCALGAVAVAATDKGVCAVDLGDNQRDLARIMRERFANAQLADAGHSLGRWIRDVIRQIEDPSLPANLPLDIAGTAFQLRVWRALQDIPAGVTRSYKDVADAIGRPTAARAVARACATNSVAVLVPCHRVVRGDGELSGYRWGVARKRKLLKSESDSKE